MQYAGIDTGAEALHICIIDDNRAAKTAPVTVIDLTNHNWHKTVSGIIAPGDRVAIEPTGWHYSAPVIKLMRHIGAQVIQVEHRTTGRIRDLHVSEVKNDKTDARALAIAARTFPNLSGMHEASQAEDIITSLRLIVSDYIRATKESTRSKNRLRQMAHAIWPSLAVSFDTYWRAITAGAISPSEIRELAAAIASANRNTLAQRYPSYNHGTSRKNLTEIAETLPAFIAETPLRDAIGREALRLQLAENQQDHYMELANDIINGPRLTDITEVWRTIPGAGTFALAALHVATHGNARGLNLARFKAAVGSHPHNRRSGETEERAAARHGYKPAKTALYLWTMAAIRTGKPPTVVAAYERHATAAENRRFNIQAGRAQLVTILWATARKLEAYHE
jgi:hypothetical protein